MALRLACMAMEEATLHGKEIFLRLVTWANSPMASKRTISISEIRAGSEISRASATETFALCALACKPWIPSMLARSKKTERFFCRFSSSNSERLKRTARPGKSHSRALSAASTLSVVGEVSKLYTTTNCSSLLSRRR